MNKVPGLFVEHSQKIVCDAGCEPKLDLWDKFTKPEVIEPLVADGAAYCGVPEATDAAIDAFDQFFQAIKTKCGEKLGASHLCDHPERLQPFMDCVQANTFSSSISSLPKLLPYMSEGMCKSMKEYLLSDQLWDHDFPRHGSKYVHQCHEL
ncbi:hypothetical protein N7448_001667 [Penicillium atrosanguineum]|uniref:Uncharacterized protein n=1 Tax=Penicillium atrosanguineum TaxID=1132637 RepID=A0A9W9LDS9_9EURO|nr:uncharacterized protein N7443_005066 [Penicillium atrosanguineum]KAJ5133303.1 hypothetical protein N7526_004668 [Penicillium atrosanguineum]KAJ5150089.1 hypothetical protein N7448_001667 [Penicillium atrosanguineum]KAJ5305406.1 hypothetical protein N7443_005066 [Penicillium atrosanguineum]KAJ5324867.1 hypothetical protein N7476_003467 [Penicillium atrosanguineum]